AEARGRVRVRQVPVAAVLRAVAVATAGARRVDVQRPRAVREHVRRDRAVERLAADHDRLERRLERGAPALPPLRGVGDSPTELTPAVPEPVHGAVAGPRSAFGDYFALERRLLFRRDLQGILDDLPVAVARHVPASRPVGEGRRGRDAATLQPAPIDATGRGEVKQLGPHELTALGLLDRLGHVERLREARPVQPRDAVADLEPGVLDSDRETVPGPGAAEREQVPARLEDAEALGRPEAAPLLERGRR